MEVCLTEPKRRGPKRETEFVKTEGKCILGGKVFVLGGRVQFSLVKILTD